MSRSLPFQRDLATEVRLLRESYDSIRSTIFGEATDNQPVQTEYNVELPRARPLSLVLEETDLKYYNNNGVATPRHDLIGFTVAPSSESNSVTSSLTPVSDTSVNRFVAPASPSRAPNLTEENLAEHDAEVSESPTSDTVKLTADTGIMADASRSHYPVFSDSPQEYPASPTTSSSKAVLFGSPREIDDADSEVLEPFPDLELGPVSEIKRTSSPIQAHEVELTSSPLENPSEISYQQTRLSTIMEDSDVETDDAVADSLELTVPKDSSAGSPDSLPALISMLQDSWNFDNTAALRAEEALTDTVANVMQANAESGIALFPPTIQQSITGADLESPPSPYPHYEIQEAASTQVGSDVNSRHETADLSSPKGSVDEIFSEHKSLPEEVELIEQLELALNSRDSSASYSQTKEDGPAPEAFNALSEIGSSPLEPVRSLETTLELRTYKARSSPTPLREDSVAHLDVSPKEDSVLSPIRQRSKLPRKVHRAKSLTRRTPIFNSVKPFGGNIIIRDSPSPEKSLLAPGVFTFDKGKNVLYAEPESMGNSSFSSPRTPTIRVSPSRGKGSKSRDRTHPPIFVRPAQGAKIPKDEGIEPFPDLKPLPLEPSTSLNTPRVPRMELYESSLMLPTDGDDHWDVD
ncbi:MAG: hypothetical protein M1814_005467 [Vezdaea aestivalis]|nr:MAG: hypothetical protein M1814_005467 [Vezdaea aestivalis]